MRRIRVYIETDGIKSFMASWCDPAWTLADQAIRIEAYLNNMAKRVGKGSRLIIDDGACRMVY